MCYQWRFMSKIVVAVTKNITAMLFSDNGMSSNPES